MNKHKHRSFSYPFFLFLAGVLFMSSCTVFNDLRYVKDVPKSPDNVPFQVVGAVPDSFESIKILPFDVLQVDIHTLDPQVNAIFNGTSEGIAANAANSGTLVDKDGIVVLPVIGKIHVAGLTTSQARDSINKVADIYLKDPIVNVRIANFKITVVGEVSKPAQYIISDEKVSVMDAIGLAGDLSIYGRRQNVLLIRKRDQEQKFVRLDISSSKFMSSPYFYLKQGDVLYVEPAKVRSVLLNPQTRNIALVSGILSIAGIILNFVKK